MSTGLLALFDDIAALVKVTAASLDDVASQAAQAGSQAAGVVIDDTAVTPKYVVGLSPARELPIIWNITKGSLKNKIFYLTPAALILGYFAPWAIQPILAIGGTYLCFEGYEKLHDVLHKMMHKNAIQDENHDHIPDNAEPISPEELERLRTSGAIRTDFILSAEIMAIAYASIADAHIATQISVLLFVAIGITAGVYGVVALIVKADDVGYHLAKDNNTQWVRSVGRSIIKGMPAFLSILGSIGTAAMLWVGGGIIIHNIAPLHHAMEHLSHDIMHLSGSIKWLFEACLSGIFGIIIGGFAALGHVHITRLLATKLKPKPH